MTEPLSSAYLGLAAAALCTLVALSTAALLGPRLGLRLAPGRSAPIDGLRGYAAFFVFVSHAAAWFYYVRTDRWANVPLRALGNLGSVSVVIFFMITAFLFTKKLLDSRQGRIDWLRMLVSRFMRLTPLYLFAMGALLLVLGAVSGFELRESLAKLLASLGEWLVFTTTGAPDLNGMRDTWLIIAGVTWSLPYEIFFYLLLPLLAIPIGAPVPRLVIVLASTGIALAVLLTRPEPVLATAFLGGALAAGLVRVPWLRALAGTSAASVGALAALGGVTALFGPFRPVPLTILSLAFLVVAAGNSLFGILTNRAARLLGEVSYSMYLLHAILLFALVRWGIGVQALAVMPAAAYWSIILCLTPLLVILCMITFTLIERPGIESAPRITASVRGLLDRRKAMSG